MEIDDPSESEEGHQSTKHKADALQSLSTTGPLSSSIAKLLGSSRTLPSEKDFHFYHNFNEFKLPVNEIADTSQLMLGTIGSSVHLWGKEMGFPDDFDDDAYDWLVNVNDEVFEKFDVSVDEFQRARKMEEDSGFQLVCGKKKKGLSNVVEGDGGGVSSSSSGVKMAFKDKKAMGVKPKIPFHIPTIPRPQDQFKIVVNNSNKPFEHVWLQKSDDGSRFIHPQERFSALDFVDKNVGHVEAVKPPPIESTPFKFVEEVKDLKELAAKLRAVDEFAVDLEHNQYRSFQGLTCLMQISTRTEDFVIDTLKLRIQIGPYLREVFKDPMKRKVMHGADRDIVWLQKDFGIYVCNMFDTGQASRVLKLERNSLEHLLYHFCGVTANKEYQNADWRLRPLPDEMVRYAREDTHYLLYIYDLLRIRLLSSSTESENSDDQLVEVYKRSYDLCMQLYEKELLTDSSYLHIYGLQGADFNAQQLAIVAGLCEWRDVIARAEDESTGYILPNKTILEIAKQKPITTSRLRHVVKSKHPYLERNLGSVVSIIRHSMQNFAAFEAAVEHLKERRLAMASEANMVSGDGNKALPCEASARLKTLTAEQSIGGGISINDSLSGHPPASVHVKDSLEIGSSTAEICRNEQERASEYTVQNGKRKSQTENEIPEIQRENPIFSRHIRETNMNFSASNPGAGATVQVLKKPSRAFGAMLGNSTAKRKFVPDKMDREEMKLEEIKSTVILPFHSFEARAEQLQPSVKESSKTLESMLREEPSSIQASSSKLEDVILIEVDSDVEESVTDAAKNEQLEPREDKTLRSAIEVSNSKLDDVILIGSDSDVEESATGASTNEQLEHWEEKTPSPALEMEEGDETVSLSDLSSSFQKCFNSAALTSKPRQADNPKQSDGFLQLKPFDYEAARKQVRFGEANPKAKLGDEEGGGHRSGLRKVDRKKSSVVDHSHKDETSGDFPQGRRRHAFPASGNRSGTFR